MAAHHFCNSAAASYYLYIYLLYILLILILLCTSAFETLNIVVPAKTVFPAILNIY